MSPTSCSWASLSAPPAAVVSQQKATPTSAPNLRQNNLNSLTDHMALADRLKYYAELEAHTGNPLLVYVTSRRPGASGIIGADAADEMIRQIEAIEGKRETVDVLIESNGGDPLVVWRMIS